MPLIYQNSVPNFVQSPPPRLYLKIHAVTRSRELLLSLRMCVSYYRLLPVTSDIANEVCQRLVRCRLIGDASPKKFRIFIHTIEERVFGAVRLLVIKYPIKDKIWGLMAMLQYISTGISIDIIEDRRLRKWTNDLNEIIK